EVMPIRLGRLQCQSRRAFWASAAPEVSTSELAGWCWARQTLIEKRAPSRWQRESMIRAARSIGAVRTSRPLQPIRKDLVIRFRRQRLAREAIMAEKEISVKKYVVMLSGEERGRLENLIWKGKNTGERV